MPSQQKKQSTFKDRLHKVIFESDAPLDRAFDISLLILISISVIAVMLDSVSPIRLKIGQELHVIEWIITVLFTVEYILRIYSSRKPFKYIFSFYGIIDLLSILPTYLSLLFIGSQYLLVIRVLRILRIFRILKLGRYLTASKFLMSTLRESRHKIVVFLEVILTIVVIMGSFMYMIEGPSNGFTSIPRSIYWAIVTLTTVGYGDISPATAFGQALASIIMIMGYAIIAVPTGIITVEMTKAAAIEKDRKICSQCNKKGHERDALFCKYCGSKL